MIVVILVWFIVWLSAMIAVLSQGCLTEPITHCIRSQQISYRMRG